MAKLVWGSDLYKGFKLDRNSLLNGAIDDILPFQMLHLEDKTEDWLHAVADYYEVAGWNNVERKAGKIERNFKMRQGILNKNDYMINVLPGDLSAAAGMFIPNNEESPLEQFYSLAPTFIDALRGEFIKRDNTWTVEAIDQFSINKAFEEKRSKFEEVITSYALLEKQQTLFEMGLSQESPDFATEMQKAIIRLQDIEFKSKSFRTTGQQWAEKVVKIHEKRYNLHELEPDGFESGLISDSEFWHLDLLDDDFKLELLNPKYCDYHKGPNIKYVSDGDYFLWFDFMSAGDIVNKFGRRMKEQDILKLKDIYVKTANIIVPDYMKSMQGAYYDLSKPYNQATDLNPAMNDAMLGKELAYNFMRTPNFDHNIEVDILNPVFGRLRTGHPQMFRVMRLYWRSMSRIGWLTRIDKDGTVHMPTWVDENYKVTIEPKYDNSVIKDKTKDNLLYGEHIDWTWRPEWRHIIKISPNQKHTFWLNSENSLQSIYIDGAPVKFQFKGRNNPFDSLPPVEGCVFSYINSNANSLIDRLKPMQIIYNICMNKVPKKFLKDYGNKVLIDKRTFSVNSPGNTTTGNDPLDQYEENLRESDVLQYTIDRETLNGAGIPAQPQVIQLSTIQETMLYLQAADTIKWMAGETVGITRQRVGQQKASETATGIQTGIAYSETQTEKYFEQHSNLMQRVRQRMLDATQYYSTFNDVTRDIYMNEMRENVFLDIEGMDNLLTHYNLYLESRANVRAALQDISRFLMEENTLEIAPSAKIQAIIEKSIPKVISLLKESEYEKAEKEKAIAERDAQLKEQQMEISRRMQAENLQHEEYQKQLDRESNERIAQIRALGGLQSDNNADGQLDAKANLDAFLKQQQIDSANKTASEEMEIKRQMDTNKMLLEREKAQMELEKEKIKGEYNLKVAKENKTNKELKTK